MQILCFWHALWLSDEDGWRKTVRSRICPVSDCRIIWVERYLLKIIKSNVPVLSRGIFIYMRLLWALGGFVPWSSQAQRWGWQVSSPQDLPFLVFFVSLAKFSSSSVLAFLTPSLYLYKQYPCILSRIPLPVSTDCIFFFTLTIRSWLIHGGCHPFLICYTWGSRTPISSLVLVNNRSGIASPLAGMSITWLAWLKNLPSMHSKSFLDHPQLALPLFQQIPFVEVPQKPDSPDHDFKLLFWLL